MGNITTSTVPQNFCFTDWQNSWPSLAALLTANIADVDNIIISATTPTAEQQDKAWLKLDANGNPDRLYRFNSGVWLSKHTDFTGKVVMWEGNEADIDALDGGETGVTITDYTGPMWEIATQLAGRSPMGPGTLASTKVIAVGDNYGEEEKTFGITNMPTHNHDIIATNEGGLSGDGGWVIGTGTSKASTTQEPGDTHYRLGETENKGEDEPDPISIVHPIYGIWFIRKTARRYYRG